VPNQATLVGSHRTLRGRTAALALYLPNNPRLEGLTGTCIWMA